MPLQNWTIFWGIGSTTEGLQMFFQIQKQRKNVWRFDLLWVFKCLVISLFTLGKQFKI
jgi:hypothetical protein